MPLQTKSINDLTARVWREKQERELAALPDCHGCDGRGTVYYDRAAADADRRTICEKCNGCGKATNDWLHSEKRKA